jgi:hypothetical protein
MTFSQQTLEALKVVFSTRNYADAILKKNVPMYEVAISNAIHKYIEQVERSASYIDFNLTLVKLDDERLDDSTHYPLLDSESPVEFPACHHMVKTTERAAFYASFMSFVQMLVWQYDSMINDDEKQKKFGFSSLAELESEIERLSYVYQDLRLLLSIKSALPFSKEEISAIYTIID